MNQHRVGIVGAGPVGLTCAMRLAQMGIASVVIELEPELKRDLRASTFHPPTLDLLDEFAITPYLLEKGRICPSWQIRIHETGENVQFNLALLKDDTAHPYRLQCEQHWLTHALMERLEAMDLVTVMMGTKVTSVTQDADKVTVLAERGGESETLEFDVLVGADGAKSTVRGQVGLSLDGETYPEETILATTTFPFEDHLPGLCNANYVWTEAGTYSLLRLPQFWRVSLYPDAGETMEEAMEPERIEAKLQRIVPRPGERYDVDEVRRYRVHRRIVSDFRVGRVALAGDAAHINSPSGGMGMNGGIHDAFCLSEAIRDVLASGDTGILDRYTRQRRPIVSADILAQANTNRSRMQERDKSARQAIFADLKALAADPERHYDRVLESSMIAGLRRAAEIA
ncbi:FAD-dependent monooxygenase [Novosphingobium sp. YJ-S2-02]|uniref:FAD-dependent monooxygenase n=1 Tax=Novosphingobium aureum TaxID=2792964 RepID=A0A931HFL4_9SPHN|nr:NAD(P)/FAD-dependent oxidoreductase [Novosphingobium aureum]MBH0114456.1 FAD-dependent monooxygenase [Novosphingobium aureum]